MPTADDGADDDVTGALEGPARDGDVGREVAGPIADNPVADGIAGDDKGVDGTARGVETGARGECGLITDSPVVGGTAGDAEGADGSTRGVETGPRGVCELITDNPLDGTGVAGAGTPQPFQVLTGEGTSAIGLPATGAPPCRGGGVRTGVEELETPVDGTADDAGRALAFGFGAAGCGLPPPLPGVFLSTSPPRIPASLIVSARSYSISGRDAVENNYPIIVRMP